MGTDFLLGFGGTVFFLGAGGVGSVFFGIVCSGTACLGY